ncbi:hypothetical protein ACFY5C_09935 [Streptomyces sp. NPDC012935]|uniref:hypothetical protein n=1 Tax=Streptomyces sp. NPDC012935 TaxID=3364857 RepID=UPI0036A66FFE
MSQTSIVVRPSADSPDDPESPPQPLRPPAMTSAETPASMRSFTVHPWEESTTPPDQLGDWSGDLLLVDEVGIDQSKRQPSVLAWVLIERFTPIRVTAGR